MTKLACLAVVMISACTVPGDSPVVWEPFMPGQSCDIVREVFGPYCVSCHNGRTEPLDLRGPAVGGLAGAIGGEFDKLLVAAGDHAASFLYKKVTAPGANEGDIMPPGRVLPPDALAALEAWIDDGAPGCEASGSDLEVGGPVDFGGPPSGFVGEQPGWAADGACSSQQWWQYQGGFASSLMHPGNDCIGCHRRGEGPWFDYAGTVYPELYDPDDCRGVPGVKVEILDEAGAVHASATSNAAGNFYIRGGWTDPYKVRLSYQGRTREMTLPAAGNGACNSCHGPDGTEGAPGRVVAP